jgi:hypothetical protein
LIVMDEVLSQLMPVYRIGSDGFQWWIGQIEDTSQFKENTKGYFRYKVRIVGTHVRSCEVTKVEDLPWAQVMMPVTSPMGPRNGGDPQLEPGQWVLGFYLDNDRQKPIIMGQLPQTPGSTSSIADYKPGKCNSFSNYKDPLINPNIDGTSPVEKGTLGQTKTTATSDGKGKTEEKENTSSNPPKPQITPRQIDAANRIDFCIKPPDTCEKRATTFGEKLENVVAEMLAAIQSNGGNIGDFLVNKATGELYGVIDDARGYINRALSLLNDFIANCKGWVIDKLEAGVKDLIENTLGLNKEGSVLNEVTKWFNSYLIEIGCSMEDLGKRLADWLTDLLMGYVTDVYRMVACQVDKLVQGILDEISKALEELLGEVLAPLEEILGVIAGPINIVGQVLLEAMSILGITCTGPNLICENWNKICTDGSTDKNKDEEEKKNFLDKLLDDIDSGIDNLFPSTNPDYTIYTCDEAYDGNTLSTTTVGFTGGVFTPGGGAGTDPTSKEKIVYSIDDIQVTEGELAKFTITRTGTLYLPSSILFETANGTADEADYIKNNGIIGFSPNEAQKTITIQTLFDVEKEKDEDFFIILDNNTPISGTSIVFEKTKGRCLIRKKQSSPDNTAGDEPKPFVPEKINPDKILDIILPDDNNNEDNPGDDIDQRTGRLLEKYKVVADKKTVKEGDFVIYTITTKNVPTGTIVYYTLTGNNITQSDIIGGSLTGFTFIENNTAQVTIGIEDDTNIELDEVMRFSINGKGAYVDVKITTDKTVDELDDGVGDGTIDTIFTPPTEPSVDPGDIITDDNGGIISIPVTNPGSPYVEPPYVFIRGTGKGASARALLDEKGFVTEIRVTRSGFGYKKNLPSDKGVRCIIDTMTLIRPGVGYTTAPTIYVDGRTDVAEAIINEKGFVIGARLLDRETTFSSYPEIFVIGGGGFGAKLIPSFACLDTDELTRVGSTKIGTGRYVDCP